MEPRMLSGEDYASLVEQAPILIWRSGTGDLDDFHERWPAFTGRPLDPEIGAGWVEGVLAEDVAHCLETYAPAFERREVFEMESRLRRHDGAYRWIFDRGGPRDGASTRQRLQAEEELDRLQEDRIETFHGLLPSA